MTVVNFVCSFLPVNFTLSALITITKSPVSTCGVNVGLFLPRSTEATTADDVLKEHLLHLLRTIYVLLRQLWPYMLYARFFPPILFSMFDIHLSFRGSLWANNTINILPSITDKVNVFLRFQKIDFHLFLCLLNRKNRQRQRQRLWELF